MQIISISPHWRAKDDSASIMYWFFIALLFPAAGAVYFFGLPALMLMIVTTLAAMLAEVVFQFLARRPISVRDGSAAITGLLLAMNLPPALPLWMAAIGAAFAIIIVKGLFGGLGFNIFNPALAARAMLLASWPVAMTTWSRPFDAVTTATPLYLAKTSHAVPGYLAMFLGNRAGCLGETSVLLLLAGAAVLLYKKIIDWPIPAAFIGTVALLSALLGSDPLFNVMAGGLVLGAIYMATDYVTAPVTVKGRFIFGLGCGVLVVLIRFFGGFPEGVCYSILIMNMLTPVIDTYVRPKLYGAKKNA